MSAQMVGRDRRARRNSGMRVADGPAVRPYQKMP
jgi:hypothetical protein